MAVLGISGMQYSGETFPDVRIVLGEDSNVFTQMISQ
ncbi:MAG: two-component system response regulator, partial [Allorhizobium sp.]